MKNFREKLKRAREKKGWSIDEAATQISAAGITNRNSYYDLEQIDGEIASNYSLNEITRICSLLNTHPRDLFFEEMLPALAIEEVVSKIREYCVKKKISIAQFEDAVGWRVESCLSKPNTALKEWNLVCLQDICRELQVDWRRVISGL
jgi:transcriptional regulator with XRE-family HTH domain